MNAPLALRAAFALAFCSIPACDSQDPATPDADAAADADAAPETADAAPEVSSRSRTLDAPVDGPGPFHVGYRTIEHTYTPTGLTEPRTITLHVWYPTTASTGDTPTYHGLFLDEEAFVNAPRRPAAGRHLPGARPQPRPPGLRRHQRLPDAPLRQPRLGRRRP
jgi:hypothetical protein